MAIEKQSLNNFLPEGFETLNQEGYKENFNENKIKTGYEKDTPDIVSGPNLNNLIDVIGKNTNTLNNYVEYLNSLKIDESPIVDTNNQLNNTKIGIRVYSATETYSLNSIVIMVDEDGVKLYKSLVAGNVGNLLSDGTYWEEISLGGGGLEVCDIGMSLYVDETKGLRRYLNGQIVDINSNTLAFLSRLKQIAILYPSLLCSEEEWQAAKTLSVSGQVGKFVFNYEDDEIVSVRIPAIVNVQGLLNLGDVGLTVQLGAFNSTDTTGTQYEVIQYPYFIQIATGQEIENNITNELELVNPYNYGDSKYSPYELDNASWLLSNGQWNAKALYPDYYNWLLSEYNKGIKTLYGWTTAGQVNYYTTSANPSSGDTVYGGDPLIAVGTATATSQNGITVTPTSGTVAVATRNTLIDGEKHVTDFAQIEVVKNGETANEYCFVLNEADETFKLPTTTALASSNQVIDGYTTQGELRLYFYIGAIAQNQGLIDTGRILEVITDFDNKFVNTAGDTMTGDLTIQNDSAQKLNMINPDYDISQAPLEAINSGQLTFCGKDNTRVGYVSNYQNIENSTVTALASMREIDGEDVRAELKLFTNSDGTTNFSFPMCETVPTTASTAGKRKVAVVVQNYRNGASWYRVWSDGWKEQGGSLVQSTNTVTITLLKPFSDTNYQVISNSNSSGTGANFWGSKTASTFTLQISTGNKGSSDWVACGY